MGNARSGEIAVERSRVGTNLVCERDQAASNRLLKKSYSGDNYNYHKMVRVLLISIRPKMTMCSVNQITSAPAAGLIARGMAPRRARSQAGIALIQVIMAMGIIALCGAAGLRALIEINRKAASMRTINQARAIVQRNIDSALGVPFNKSLTPPILAITTASGAVYDDEGNGDNLQNITVGRSGSGAVVQGTLTRIVVAESNPDNVDIRRITFRLSYTYRLKPYTYEMTTLRSMD